MKQRIVCLVLSALLFTGLFHSVAVAAVEWPDDVSIEADAGIVMDARSGAVLYGKNIHSTFSPASITKVLTALVVLENCQMDEIVTFSRNAVYNVEANSSSAGYDTGDQASVKNCLYALILKSANEAANALAEHIAGTTEDFARMMNEKAAELGCVDSNFTNPSGLNDDEHYVSAYDMALITKAAFSNEIFSTIAATTYYKLPPSKINPEGLGISPGNRMVRPSLRDYYRPDVIGGKTGYTSIALNTLVICAEQEDTKLVTVILHSKGTQYNDTKKLLDFGFRNFESIKIAEHDETYSSIGDSLKISGIATSAKPILSVDPDSRITLPKTAAFSEAVASLDYALPQGAPTGAIASVNYVLGERFIGRAYLTLSEPPAAAGLSLPQALLEVTPTAIEPAAAQALTASSEEGTDAALVDRKSIPETPEDSRKVPSLLWKVLAVIAIAAAVTGTVIYIIISRRKREYAEQQQRRMRRAERLKESGISEAEFNLMMKERYSSSASSKRRSSKGRSNTKKDV